MSNHPPPTLRVDRVDLVTFSAMAGPPIRPAARTAGSSGRQLTSCAGWPTSGAHRGSPRRWPRPKPR